MTMMIAESPEVGTRPAGFCAMPRRWLPVVALLAGCATAPAPPERIFAYQAGGPHTATVVIERRANVFGAAVAAEIIVDGDSLAAQLRNGETVTLYLPAGEHRMGVSPRLTFFGPQYVVGCQMPYKFEAGETYYLNLATDEAGEWCILERPGRRAR